MSSNNTSNIVGVRDMANGSGGGDYESSSLRKAKKQRIPKRGPGVAELEKILREQEQKDGHTSSSLVPSLPNFYPSLPRSASFLADNHHHHHHPSSPPPSMAARHGNCNGSSQLRSCGNVGGNNGPSKGVYINGSGVYLPEQTLLPISWGSSEEPAPKMAADFSFPMPLSNGSGHTVLQRNHLSMMDLFPLSTLSSSSTTPSSSTGVYHHVEPPSNQKPCYISTLLPEEDKMMSAKRSRPNVPVENWPAAAPSRMSFQQPIRPQVSRLDPSSSSTNNGVFSFGISGDSMPTNPLELKLKTCVNDNPSGNGNGNGNGSRPFITLLSSPTTQNCQPDLPKFIKQFPFQENNEGCLLQKSSSESEVLPVHNKSFFSFLLQSAEEVQRGSTSAEATLYFSPIDISIIVNTRGLGFEWTETYYPPIYKLAAYR
ncbi:hypothetical protein V6Z12_A10G033600 [Gossypium hirsutum]